MTSHDGVRHEEITRRFVTSQHPVSRVGLAVVGALGDLEVTAGLMGIGREGALPVEKELGVEWIMGGSVAAA